MPNTPLFKTNNRDLTFSSSDNLNLLQFIIESEARKTPPVHVPPNDNPFGGPYQTIPGTKLSGHTSSDKSISWGEGIYLGTPQNVQHGWANLHAEIHNVSRVEGIQILAQKYSVSSTAPMEMSAHKPRLLIKKNEWHVPYGQITINGVEATLMCVIPISFPRQGAQYMLAIFQSPCGKILHLPSAKTDEYDVYQTRTPPEYSWGFSPDDIPLSELDVLERYPSAAVLLTDDAWLAHQINRYLTFLDEDHHEHLVAVSIWAGTSRIVNYDYAPLQGREITYVPTLHRDSIAAGIELRSELNSIGVEDFKILLKPFAANTSSIDDSRCECGNYACDNAIEFSRRNILLMLDTIKNSWSFDRYKRFCQEEGLIEMEQQASEKQNTPLFMSATDISDAANREGEGVVFSLERVFDPSNITIIVGESDAGKTLFARAVALGIATATEVFGMTASKARDVYSINAEQDIQKSDAYTKRSMTSLGITEIPNRFNDLPELSLITPEGFGPLDVLDANWQDYILEQVSPGSVLIVDNLLAGSEKNFEHASGAKALRKFAKRLQEKRISLIVVHHTGKGGDAMGSKALENLAQNFILIHQAEPRENYEGGVNALVTFRKIKNYPRYKGKQFSAHLKYAETELDGTPWIFEEAGTISSEDKPALQEKPDVAGLHRIQQAAILYAFEHEKVTRRNLVDKGFEEESVKTHLKKLVEDKWLTLHGKGRGAYYAYNTRDISH